ncbi:hypothetical protein AURDEDRAFT_113005 [Auricularia subglabra TFB-10046 SS5]|nr:hypothetical protein AURDEDRAFT_113005 [Auricularia subglabra TFB-10046 SS5]
MSAQSTPDASPIQPLHHPEQAAQIQVPQAPLGNATNAPGMGGKALLAKKLAAGKPAYVSPSDQLMTPCTAKLSQAKKKHFNKGKPIRFAFNAGAAAADDDDDDEKPSAPTNGSPLAQSAQEDDEDKMDVEEAEQAPASQSRLQPAEF